MPSSIIQNTGRLVEVLSEAELFAFIALELPPDVRDDLVNDIHTLREKLKQHVKVVRSKPPKDRPYNWNLP